MGQVFNAAAAGIILSNVDRLLATNADGGLSPLATHVILLGQAAGQNMGAVTNAIAIGWNAGIGVPATGTGLIALGVNSANGLAAPNGIVIGNNSVKGPLATLGYDDLISIGNRSWPALTSQATSVYGMISIGSDIGINKTVTNFDGGIFIGNEIFFTDPSVGNGTAGRMICIGHGFMRNAVSGGVTATGDSVYIGNLILQNAFNGIAGNQAVVVGCNMLNGIVSGGGFSYANAVFIGGGIDAGVTGANICGCTYVVAVGSGITMVASASNGSRNKTVALGYANAINGPSSIQLGPENQGPRGGTTTILGYSNDFGAAPLTFADNLIIGNGITYAAIGTTMDAGGFLMVSLNATNQLIFGKFSSGNIVLGNSSNAQKDLETIAPTNAVKLINGTRGAGNPNTGGFFYSALGILHWVNSAGVDQAVSMGGSTVAALPAAAATIVGSRAYVTDANAPVFGAAVAGGGAVTIPVFCNGAAWIVG
jgi:hypothetical protein